MLEGDDIDLEDFIPLIRRAIRDEVAAQVEAYFKATPIKEFYTEKQLAQFLEVSQSTVAQWRRNGRIHFSQPPGMRKYFYTREQVLTFLNENEQYNQRKEIARPKGSDWFDSLPQKKGSSPLEQCSGRESWSKRQCKKHAQKDGLCWQHWKQMYGHTYHSHRHKECQFCGETDKEILSRWFIPCPAKPQPT